MGRELKAGRFATAVRLEWEHNLNVLAQILLNGEFTFCPIRDFNELAVAEEHTRQLLRDVSFTTSFRQHEAKPILEDKSRLAEPKLFRSPRQDNGRGALGRESHLPSEFFMMFVRGIFRCEVPDCPASDYRWRTMFDEVNYYTSILKIGHLARYQRSLPWGECSGRADTLHYREAI
jgi:hypothetical protein